MCMQAWETERVRSGPHACVGMGERVACVGPGAGVSYGQTWPPERDWCGGGIYVYWRKHRPMLAPRIRRLRANKSFFSNTNDCAIGRFGRARPTNMGVQMIGRLIHSTTEVQPAYLSAPLSSSCAVTATWSATVWLQPSYIPLTLHSTECGGPSG